MKWELRTGNWEVGTRNWELGTAWWWWGAMRGLLTGQVISGQMRGLQINQIGGGGREEGGGAIKIGQKGGGITP